MLAPSAVVIIPQLQGVNFNMMGHNLLGNSNLTSSSDAPSSSCGSRPSSQPSSEGALCKIVIAGQCGPITPLPTSFSGSALAQPAPHTCDKQHLLPDNPANIDAAATTDQNVKVLNDSALTIHNSTNNCAPTTNKQPFFSVSGSSSLLTEQCAAGHHANPLQGIRTSESWVVMEMCEGGSMSSAVHGGLFENEDGSKNMVSVTIHGNLSGFLTTQAPLSSARTCPEISQGLEATSRPNLLHSITCMLSNLMRIPPATARSIHDGMQSNLALPRLTHSAPGIWTQASILGAARDVAHGMQYLHQNKIIHGATVDGAACVVLACRPFACHTTRHTPAPTYCQQWNLGHVTTRLNSLWSCAVTGDLKCDNVLLQPLTLNADTTDAAAMPGSAPIRFIAKVRCLNLPSVLTVRTSVLTLCAWCVPAFTPQA